MTAHFREYSFVFYYDEWKVLFGFEREWGDLVRWGIEVYVWESIVVHV